MSTIKTKYHTKVGPTMFSPGTIVRQASLEEMKKTWPGIENNNNSNSVGVWFPGRSYPTIISKSQLLICNDDSSNR
jgi:hypothetical protein